MTTRLKKFGYRHCFSSTELLIKVVESLTVQYILAVKSSSEVTKFLLFDETFNRRNILTDEFINRRKYLTDELLTIFLNLCV